jgi:four helix bundle protein
VFGREVEMKIPLQDLEVYRLAEDLSDRVWKLVATWKGFDRETVGKQMVRAADSIGANLAEGYGRYSFRENIHFCYYARGSYYELLFWLRRSSCRSLSPQMEDGTLHECAMDFGRMLNAYIRSIKRNLSESSRFAEANNS